MADISDSNGKGEAALAELRIAYSDAMWSWAAVEGELFAVYVTALRAYPLALDPLRRSYFKIVSARSRLDVTNAAARSAWATAFPNRLQTWMALAKRCQDELARRGEIAHLQGEIAKPEKSHQKFIAVLVQHRWHPDKAFTPTYKDLKNRGTDATQLREMEKAWATLSKNLAEFIFAIWQVEQPAIAVRPQASPAPKGAPAPQAQSPARPTSAAPQAPPQSSSE